MQVKVILKNGVDVVEFQRTHAEVENVSLYEYQGSLYSYSGMTFSTVSTELDTVVFIKVRPPVKIE